MENFPMPKCLRGWTFYPTVSICLILSEIRMHSSRMRTTRYPLPPMHAPPTMHSPHHTHHHPLPCMTLAMYTPCMPLCHTHPLPCMPPFPCHTRPPAIHAPCHTCPLACTPPVMHVPLWIEWQMLVKISPCTKLRLRVVINRNCV